MLNFNISIKRDCCSGTIIDKIASVYVSSTKIEKQISVADATLHHVRYVLVIAVNYVDHFREFAILISSAILYQLVIARTYSCHKASNKFVFVFWKKASVY